MSRRENDFYQTPNWQVEALREHQFIAGKVLEPCAGDGSISLLFNEYGHKVITNDIDAQWPTDYHYDATVENAWKLCPVGIDWVVTNPPFNGAFSILKHAYQHVGRVALLLRLSFLEPTKQRGLWLSQNPPDKLIVLPRWSYTANGKSDSVTTAWMIWDRFNRPAQNIVIYPTKPGRKHEEVSGPAVSDLVVSYGGYSGITTAAEAPE
jgi:hypothetical protein